MHQRECHRIGVPFTDLEAENAQASNAHVNNHNVHSTPSEASDDVVEGRGLNHVDMEQIADDDDDDDYPNIADWIADATAGGEVDLGSPAHDTDTSVLDMFDAFDGTPRAKVEKMRQAINKHYGVDIGNPTRKGRQVLDDMLGDIVKPVNFDCCADGCVAFTGRLLSAASCPSCGKGRYNVDGQPNYWFQYIPLIPRLRLQYSNAKRSQGLSSHRASFDPAQPDSGHRNDVLDGDWFRQCWDDGYFHDNRDLALRLTLDGIGVVKHPKKRQLITPVVLYLLNLHPSIRENASNALVTHLIPGGFSKDFMDTWLHPLVEELLQLHDGVPTYDGASRREFTLRAHLILVTGDGPAIADVMGTKSPGKSKQSCRLCPFTGTQGRGRKYYYPNGDDLQPMLHVDMRAQIEQLDRRRPTHGSQQQYNNARRDTGVTCRSILLDLPTLHFPRSFPIDTMHSMNHNIPKSMFRLWKATRYPQAGQENRYPWVIPDADWDMIDQSMLASRATVPTHVGTAPRSTGSFGNWTTHEWRSHFVTYGAPALCQYLPEPYRTNFLYYRQLLCYTNQRGFTPLEIREVENQAAAFVREYERLYYDGNPDLLPSCTIQYHYLLHLGQNIRDFGPPSCFAQWTLERFLRTVRRFSTATVYKHQSAEINMLTRERRLHARWRFPRESASAASHDLDYADDAAQPPGTHRLERRSHAEMDPKWQRELGRINNPREPWYTGTPAAELALYHTLVLPSGARVGTYSKQKGLVLRNKSLVMYYADTSGQRETVRLLFGTVVVLYEDPGNSTQWAGIARWRKVQPASSLNGPPRPRMFDEDNNSMLWISVNLIVDIVGAAQVYYRRGVSTQKCLYIVDKHCYSDVDTPQDVAHIGQELAAMY
jgi:hypothetical protein